MAKTKKGLAARTADATPRSETVYVCIDGDAIGLLHRLEAELQQAIVSDRDHNRTAEAPKIARRIEETQQRAKDHTVQLLLRSVGKTPYRQLMEDNPPTKKQLADNPRLDHNPDTFPLALVAASLAEVDGEPDESTPDDVEAFFEPLPQGEWARVYQVALNVNAGLNSVPFSAAASRLLRGSEPSSTPAESEG